MSFANLFTADEKTNDRSNNGGWDIKFADVG